MKVLGRKLVNPFDSFWSEYVSEIEVLPESIQSGHSSGFGDQGADKLSSHIPKWMELPDGDLCWHVAHEISHLVVRNRGFPRTAHGPLFEEDSPEVRIGGDIEEMVLHQVVDYIMEPFGFTNEAILTKMTQGALTGLKNSPAPSQGTPWFYTWAIRYSELKLTLDDVRWSPIDILYNERSPGTRELGERILDIVNDVGTGTPQQSLEVMVNIRDVLGFGLDGSILIVDQTQSRII